MNMTLQTTQAKTSVLCRSIRESDLDAILELLTRGFKGRTLDYWRRGLDRHAERPVPEGCTPFGYMMESQGRPVGVVLTLHSTVERNGEVTVRNNLSSWYVEPAYRPFASLLDHVAVRNRRTTHFNISPAPHTWAMHEARGFVRYCTGQVVAFPALHPVARGSSIRRVRPGDPLDDLPARERRVVADHVGFGCICLVATDADGSRPFVFVRRPTSVLRHRLGWSPLSYFLLAYCMSTSDLPRFAGVIGRHLLVRHAMPLIVVDATGPIAGLAGRYVEGRGVKFKRGPGPVPLGDLAYSELVLFGA